MKAFDGKIKSWKNGKLNYKASFCLGYGYSECSCDYQSYLENKELSL